ncbi:MAG: TerB family tellurite resistance protein [Pseudomonadota bacterium]
MSIWQRLKAAVAALGRGEPLSAVLERLSHDPDPEHSVAFTIAVIALGAKMAKADGRVTRDEIAAFRKVFNIPPDAEEQAARIYNMARTDVAGFESYAAQVARMFKDRPAMLEDLLEGLVYIAAADGAYHPGEAAFLEEVARIFEVAPDTFRSIRARHLPGEEDPWAVLGVAPNTPEEELRRQYRRLVRRLHPDALVARGVPSEARALAERRLAAVNAAFAEVTGRKPASSRA